MNHFQSNRLLIACRCSLARCSNYDYFTVLVNSMVDWSVGIRNPNTVLIHDGSRGLYVELVCMSTAWEGGRDWKLCGQCALHSTRVLVTLWALRLRMNESIWNKLLVERLLLWWYFFHFSRKITPNKKWRALYVIFLRHICQNLAKIS